MKAIIGPDAAPLLVGCWPPRIVQLPSIITDCIHRLLAAAMLPRPCIDGPSTEGRQVLDILGHLCVRQSLNQSRQGAPDHSLCRSPMSLYRAGNGPCFFSHDLRNLRSTSPVVLVLWGIYVMYSKRGRRRRPPENQLSNVPALSLRARSLKGGKDQFVRHSIHWDSPWSPSTTCSPDELCTQALVACH